MSALAYYPFGATRASIGTLGTDRKYTGQRLDGSGLYFYNVWYYDASLGRFESKKGVAVLGPLGLRSLGDGGPLLL